jgi:hypothetical protein
MFQQERASAVADAHHFSSRMQQRWRDAMSGFRVLRIVALSAVLAAPAVSAALAQSANRSFDGQWIVDVPSSTVLARTSESACPGMRLPVRIEGGQVTGMLTRVPARAGALIVESGVGPDSAPITGNVSADGVVHARWENYLAAGQLSGDGGQITVQTSCGPEVSRAVRINQ